MKHAPTPALFSIVIVLLAMTMLPTVISQQSGSQAVVRGKHIFNQSCTVCHDTLGTATKSGPALKNYYRHKPRPVDASVRAIIQQGKGKMPAFSTLSRLQLDELVAYLKTL